MRATARNKQVSSAAMQFVRPATRELTKMSGYRFRYQCGFECASVLIGATRCSEICGRTVLLETQGPCGSVRDCRADTVTYDTSAPVGKNVTAAAPGLSAWPPTISGHWSVNDERTTANVHPDTLAFAVLKAVSQSPIGVSTQTCLPRCVGAL